MPHIVKPGLQPMPPVTILEGLRAAKANWLGAHILRDTEPPPDERGHKWTTDHAQDPLADERP